MRMKVEMQSHVYEGWLGLFPKVMRRVGEATWELGAYMDYSAFLEPDLSGMDLALKPRISGKRIPNLLRSYVETQGTFIGRFSQEFKDWTGHDQRKDPGTVRALGRGFVRSMANTVRLAKNRAPVEFAFHRRTIKAVAASGTVPTKSRPGSLAGRRKKRK